MPTLIVRLRVAFPHIDFAALDRWHRHAKAETVLITDQSLRVNVRPSLIFQQRKTTPQMDAVVFSVWFRCIQAHAAAVLEHRSVFVVVPSLACAPGTLRKYDLAAECLRR